MDAVERAADRGERGHDPVSEVLDLDARMGVDGDPEQLEVGAPDLVSCGSAQSGGELRRTDQVGEDDGRRGGASFLLERCHRSQSTERCDAVRITGGQLQEVGRTVSGFRVPR